GIRDRNVTGVQTCALPIFDIRSIGPQDPTTGLVLGGNKSLLFNIEQNINIAGPVRLILFYDAGQVRDVGQNLVWKEHLVKVTVRSEERRVGKECETGGWEG